MTAEARQPETERPEVEQRSIATAAMREEIATYVDGQDDRVRPLAGDQFAGIGGLTAGLWEAKFNLGTTCERGLMQRRELRRRYGGQANPVKMFEELTPAHFAGHFLVTSAAPCTPFSRAGYQRAHDHSMDLD